MIIQALEWRNRFVEMWNTQGSGLGTALPSCMSESFDSYLESSSHWAREHR